MRYIVEYRAQLKDGSIEQRELEIIANTAREAWYKGGLAVLDAQRNGQEVKRARIQRVKAR